MRDRLRHPPRRVDAPAEDVDDRPARGLAAEPRLDHRLRMCGDLVEKDGRPVGEDDHDVRIDGCDSLQHGELVVGQVHVGPIEALGLVRRGQPSTMITTSADPATCSASAWRVRSSRVSPTP